MKLAGCDFVIKFSFRPCLVEGRQAMWHRWVYCGGIAPPSVMVDGHRGGSVSATFALVEFEDGSVAEVLPHKVQFLDSAEQFEQYDFTKKPKEDENERES